jgi:hypothetical protein
MSSETLFGDDVVQITEFKKRAKTYAERARQRPLTIVQGGVADLALVRRDLVGAALRQHHHLIQAVDLLLSQVTGKPISALAWANDLDAQERATFASQYAAAIQRAEALGHAEAWDAVDELVEDWTATAEALQNPELVDAVAALRERASR